MAALILINIGIRVPASTQQHQFSYIYCESGRQEMSSLGKMVFGGTGELKSEYQKADFLCFVLLYGTSPTVSAAVRLMPKPPALVLNRNTKISFLERKEIKKNILCMRNKK